MSDTELSTNAEKIQTHFDYLFRDNGFSVVSEIDYGSFGNWAVVLTSALFRIRFMMDRGWLDLQVGPLSTGDWRAGPWHSLGVVVEFLVDDQEPGEPTLDPAKVQMERLSQKLRLHFDQIRDLLHADVYPLERARLSAFTKARINRILDEMTRRHSL